MRKFVLFALLFGAGLWLLLWLRREPPRDTGEPPAPPASVSTEFTDVPVAPPSEDEAQKRVGIVLDGPLEITQFAGEGASRKPRVLLKSTDVDALGGDAYDLKQLDVELRDVETGEAKVRMTSPRSRVALTIVDGKPVIGARDVAQFTDVTIDLQQGGPVAPLEAIVPLLFWEIEAQRMRSDDAVVIRGQGLDARGDGLLAELGSERFELTRNGLLKLDLRQRGLATLQATRDGAISVSRTYEGELPDRIERLELVAKNGARLVVSGDEPFTLDADEIVLRGRPAKEGDETFVLEDADARGNVIAKSRGDRFRAREARFTFGSDDKLSLATLTGDVVLQRGDDTFESDDAVFEFDGAGELELATLRGAPRGSIVLENRAPADRPELARVKAEINGAGPLVVRRADGGRVELAGPGRVVLPGQKLSIDARDRLEGRVAADQKSGSLQARGAVVAAFENQTLKSEQLDVEWKLDEHGDAIVDAVTNGSTQIDGKTKKGEVFAMQARGGLSAHFEDDRFTVPEARDVELRVDGAQPFRAQAQVVRNVQWDERRLEAERDVVLTLTDGRASAERAIVRGLDDVELFGVSHRPARFRMRRGAQDDDESVDATVSALHVRGSGRSLAADGDAHARIVTRGATLDATGARLSLELVPEGLPGPSEPHRFTLLVEEKARMEAVRGNETAVLRAARIETKGRVLPRSSTREAAELELGTSDARGDVELSYVGDGSLEARGDVLSIDGRRRGRIAAGAGRKVHATGRFPNTSLPYTLDAHEIVFDPDKVEASGVEARLDRSADPIEVAKDALKGAIVVLDAFRADRVVATKQRIDLEGKAHLEGQTSQAEPWTLDAGDIALEGDFASLDRVTLDDLRTLTAERGFTAVLGERVKAQGETLRGAQETIEILGNPARLELLDAVWESNRFQYRMEQMLLATDSGTINSVPGAEGASYSLSYESLQPFDQPEGSILLALRNPRFRLGAQQLFADWALFWVDPDEWRRTGRSLLSKSIKGEKLRVGVPVEGQLPPVETEARRKQREERSKKEDPLEQFRENPIFEFLSEVYLEGNLEVFDAGERQGRAGALYLDIVEGHGWLRDADVEVDIDVRGLPSRLRAKAGWMRVSPGPTLRADRAVITSCDYDVPHYVIETADLRIDRQQSKKDERVAWSVTAENNSIRFENGFALPLPPLIFETNEEGDPLIDRMVLGDSAKFGTQIRASLNTGLGSIGFGVGKVFSKLLDFPDTDIRGRWRYDAGYLGSRGVILGAGLDLRAKEKFRLEATLSGIPDGSSDKGLVRVDRDDRSLLRAWFRARGRYTLDPEQWVDIAISRQTDPGVQSEFFERDFLFYEQKDNFLHWRRARDEWYANASVKVLIEDRTDIEELPSAGLYKGRAPIGAIGERPLYYTGYLDAAWLRRKEGETPFYAPYPDGLGDRDVARVDTQHRIETPIALGVLGARATPFVAARATGWSEGADESETPARAALFAGFEMATTFWRRFPKGSVHTLTPSLELRTDLASEETGGDLIPFDIVEQPVEGRFVEAGIRSRWWKIESKDRLDLDVRLAHGSSLPEGEREGIQPLLALAEYYTFVDDIPVGLTLDARYDLREHDTLYSRTYFGFEPTRQIGIEFGHHRGLDVFGDGLYEAASAGARYRWTSKWEIEFDQTYSLSSGRGLGNEVVVRRLGHDFVLEIEVGYRAGEGTSFGLSVLPQLSYKRSSLGLIDRWLGLYH